MLSARYIIGRNYGKSFSLLSLGGIVAVAGIARASRSENKPNNKTTSAKAKSQNTP